MIPFFKTTITGNEQKYLQTLLEAEDGLAGKEYLSKSEKWFNENHGLKNFYLTKSCTHSLELAALLLNLQPGDEVIMPSYAFVSCANAIALRGATCVFVDVHPDSMNIDESQIEAAITPHTKAILTLNYAGVACNYEVILPIAKKYGLSVIEDNAHGIGAKYKGRFLGTFGDISTFSFDHLKNVTCVQGGGMAINNPTLFERFYVTYEFGTNRRAFFKGDGDRYEWKGLGSNFPLSELSAAMLLPQLEVVKDINAHFINSWNLYSEKLSDLATEGTIKLPLTSEDFEHNGHCFFIKTKSAEERTSLIHFLESKGIQAQFHYTPLHSSEFGRRVGRFVGQDNTSWEGKTILRLPLFYGITASEVETVTEKISEFYLK